MTNARSRTRDVNAAVRVEQAIEMRAKKHTYEEIALKCGYASRGACHDAVMRELNRRVVTNVDALRLEELDSLERLEKICWERLTDKSKDYQKAKLFAVDRIIAIKERRAKLMGLDAKPDEDLNRAQVVIREVPAGYLEAPTQ